MTGKKFDVVCIGLIVSDVLISSVDKGIFEADTTQVENIVLSPGGDAMNEAVILAKLGIKVGLAGKIGNDIFGRMVLAEAEKNGVDIANVKIDTGTRTTTSVVLVNKNGERNFVNCKGNNDVLSLEDIDLSIIKQAKLVSVGSLFELPLLEKGGIEVIFREARENRVITSADVTHDVYGLGLEGIKGILRLTDILIPSYTEAVYLTKEKDPAKAAEILLGYGVKMVVIKLGKQGCLIKTGQECHFIGAFDVKAVDTTGAGDNFVAGFLTGILNGWDLKKSGLFANAVGAICVGSIGATTAVKDLSQVMGIMEGS